MEKEIIKTALVSALNLLNSEVESVCIEELKDEYLQTILQIENGLSELER